MGHTFCIFFILVLATHAAWTDDQSLLQLTTASTGFSQRLYKHVALKPNVVYSPYSIHSVLSMTYMGARGDTATEMSATLGLTSLSGDSTHQAYHDLMKEMNSATDVKLYTANGLFVNKDETMSVLETYQQDAINQYMARVTTFDVSAPDGPEKVINDFVAQRTENAVMTIVPPGTIDGSTVAVLVNSIFFNGSWEIPFQHYMTKQKQFQQLGGAISMVDMMSATNFFKVKTDHTNGVDVIELPFKDNRFCLNIVLPHKSDGLTAMENLLMVPGKTNELFEGLKKEAVQLNLPKFKIESSMELTSALKSMGMVKVFDSRGADLSGITDGASTYISNVFHKATIDVMETGTVASAATAVLITFKDLLIPSQTFNADHPFAFFLRYKPANEILFQGRFSG